MLVVDRHKDRLPLSQCLNCVHVFPIRVSAFSRFPALTARRPSSIPITNQTGQRLYRLHPQPFWVISLAINLFVTLLHCDITLIHNYSFSLIVAGLPFTVPSLASPISFSARQNLSSSTPISLSRSSTPTVNPHPFVFVISLSLT